MTTTNTTITTSTLTHAQLNPTAKPRYHAASFPAATFAAARASAFSGMPVYLVCGALGVRMVKKGMIAAWQNYTKVSVTRESELVDWTVRVEYVVRSTGKEG